MRIQSNRICFTINNYETEGITPEIIENFGNKIQNDVHFFIVGIEVGEKGTPHIQGFVHHKTLKREGIKYWKYFLNEIGGQKAHLENAKGTDEQSLEYCSKEGNWISWGTPQEGVSIYKTVIQAYRQGGYSAALEIDDECTVKYANQIKTIANSIEALENSPQPMQNVQLRPWQQKAVDLLNQQDSRTILIVIDEIGNNGKTFLATYLRRNFSGHTIRGILNLNKDTRFFTRISSLRRHPDPKVRLACAAAPRNG